MSARVEDSIAWARHDFFEFALCRAGCGQVDIDDRIIGFRPGSTFLIAPGVRHRLLLQPGSADLKFLCMSVQDIGAYLAAPQRAFLDAVRATSASFADHGSNLGKLQELSDMIPDGFDFGDTRELAVLWGIIGLLLALHAKAGETHEDYGWGRYQQKIGEIRQWIDARLHRTISLEEVGAHFGLSRSLLTREFRRHTGKSFIDYCNWRRVEKAANLLIVNGVSVTQAALESGFSNLSHFYRQFKTTYGVTPTAFRHQVLGSEEADPEDAADLTEP